MSFCLTRFTSRRLLKVGEARPALCLGRGIQPVRHGGKGGGLLLRQYAGQILVKPGLDLRLGGFQFLRLRGWVQQLTAPVCGVVPAREEALCLQIFCPPRDCGFVGVQELPQFCLRAAGIVPQGMDQVDFRRAHPLLAQGKQNQFLRLPRDFGHFSFGFVHKTPLSDWL